MNQSALLSHELKSAQCAGGPQKQRGKMFKAENSTVFILGAGASWHYGYPTGEDLVKMVMAKAALAGRFFDHSRRVQNPEWSN
jgi:hypothetical protein